METEESAVPIRTKALRLWPGVAAAVAIVVFRIVIPAFIPDAGIFGMAAALAGTLAIVIWWLFFSRASWLDRIGAIALLGGSLGWPMKLDPVALAVAVATSAATGIAFGFFPARRAASLDPIVALRHE